MKMFESLIKIEYNIFNLFKRELEEYEAFDEPGEYTNQWNPLRRQMYYAVQLFITRYQHILKPGTKIFRLLQSITDEQHIHLEPQKFQFQIFVDVVTKFNTNLPKVMVPMLYC